MRPARLLAQILRKVCAPLTKCVPESRSCGGTKVAIPACMLRSILVLGIVLGGCRREEITHYQVPKAQAAPAAQAVPTDIAPPPAAAEAGLAWTLPKGWTDEAGSGMRYATIKPTTPKVDVSVIVLPGPAGGELANVNRWRGQLGLQPIDESAMNAARKALKAPAGAISVYDFSDGQKKNRLIAGLTVLNGSTWFVKMTGEAAAVNAARPDFLNLLQSLHASAN